MPSALIADDEPNLSAELAARLTRFWPELQIVSMPRDGGEALAQLNEKRPDFAFLDIRMPGIDGLKVAQLAAPVRVVFVTAYDAHAVDAFEAAATDYLLKPVTDERLLRCIARLQQSGAPERGAAADELTLPGDVAPIRWLTVGIKETTKLVSIDDVLFFQATDKYTEVVTRDQRHLIRTPLKELLPRLDGEQFARIHRGVIVAYAAVDYIEHDLLGRLRIHVVGGGVVLPVSRAYAALFKRM
ncbi:MAG: response regulator transcription factor [Pandoraea sp.]|uniref:LytR/AlgR family response regulator transcription factor n=1 Tax=Pandoraea sp. TaxID=1883445 RepID=UPI00121B9A79|nr:LytTR family DNA-binding domain-containing protein [Pandoraea sp.]TAM13389.1 MAG: response regulator transcription factor [Pandoraea sp.]TAM54236.1 MAG: response regulator transcription factor [Paraburkholderia sp.]